MRRSGIVVAAVIAVGLVAPTWAAAEDIRVESTTDTKDAGLVEGLLRPEYKKVHPDDTILYDAVGTGKALQNARDGKADIVITHAPSLEAQFVHDGVSIGLGRQIFYSDYIIIGPKEDPAGILAADPHDAVGAFEDIATAGDADSDAVRFNSRADASGTNVQEQIIWGLTGASVPKHTASNAGTDTTRQEPFEGGAYPDWYRPAPPMTGQAANVQNTETCAAAGNGCYTMTDRGTFNNLVNQGLITHLKVVSEKNDAGARGGPDLLINPFSAYLVNPDAITTDPKPNVAAATRLMNFLVSPDFQAKVASFPSALDPAFHPDAAPALDLDAPLPAAAAEGDVLTIAGVASNRVPGAEDVEDLPVQLQQSRNGGATWSNVGGPARTDADGKFSLDTTIDRTTSYRLTTPDHAARTLNGTTYNQFTASTQNLGAVGIPTPPSGGGSGTTPPPAGPAPDITAPRVTGFRLTTRGLRLHVSEAAKITVRIQRRVKRKGKIRYRTVTTYHLTAGRARTFSRRHRKLGKGRYHVRITATDTAGNRRTLVRSVRRR